MPVPTAEMSDHALVHAWRAGEVEALRLLINRYRSAVFGMALWLCGNYPQAEALAQEAFLHAAPRLHRFDAAQSFMPWIFGLLGHLYIEGLHKRNETPSAESDTLPAHCRGGDQCMQRVLLHLSGFQRAILVLRELAGLHEDEIAQAFHLPTGTVRARLSHARAAFVIAYEQLSTAEAAQ